MIKKSGYDAINKRIALITMSGFHLQLIFGLSLYFISQKVIFDSTTMKNSLSRFFTLEHPLLMMVSIVLITVAYLKAKKRNSAKSHSILFIYGLIVLIILLLMIPWPFRESLGVNWI